MLSKIMKVYSKQTVKTPLMKKNFLKCKTWTDTEKDRKLDTAIEKRVK